jgi:hypothetical protein
MDGAPSQMVQTGAGARMPCSPLAATAHPEFSADVWQGNGGSLSPVGLRSPRRHLFDRLDRWTGRDDRKSPSDPLCLAPAIVQGLGGRD